MANSRRRIFYAADLHLGHRSMPKYEKAAHVPNAPDTVEDRDRLIMENWNATVSRNDDVWILGDVAYAPETAFLRLMRQLNGHKRIVMGNHDKTWVRKFAQTHKGDVVDVVDYARISDKGRKVVLSHYPIAFWDCQHQGAYHLYGHVHTTAEEDLFQAFGKGIVDGGHLPEFRAINVGIMAMGYAPRTLDQLIEQKGFHDDAGFADARRHWIDENAARN